MQVPEVELKRLSPTLKKNFNIGQAAIHVPFHAKGALGKLAKKHKVTSDHLLKARRFVELLSNRVRRSRSQRKRRSIAKTNDAAAGSNERTAATIRVPTAIFHEHLRRIRAMSAAEEKVAELALVKLSAAQEPVGTLAYARSAIYQQSAVQAQ